MEISRSEAATQLGVSLRTLDRYIANGSLPATRHFNGRVSLDAGVVDSFAVPFTKTA